jgi:hypothetical protein
LQAGGRTSLLPVQDFVFVHWCVAFNTPGSKAKKCRPHRDGLIFTIGEFSWGLTPSTSDRVHSDPVETTVLSPSRLVRSPLRTTCSRCWIEHSRTEPGVQAQMDPTLHQGNYRQMAGSAAVLERRASSARASRADCFRAFPLPQQSSRPFLP